MGLDTGASLLIPQASGGIATVDIFYFRKCYSLSRKLRDFSLIFKGYAENLEYDGEYGFTIDLSKYENEAWSMIFGMARILKTEVENFEKGINEINFEEDNFENDSIWGNGHYIAHVNADALRASALALYLDQKITFETLLDILDNEIDSIDFEYIEHPEYYNLKNMKLKFYYSY
jgi:hypothetical protein